MQNANHILCNTYISCKEEIVENQEQAINQVTYEYITYIK